MPHTWLPILTNFSLRLINCLLALTRSVSMLALMAFASKGAMAATPTVAQVASVQFDDVFLKRPEGVRMDV
ncbi:hypothetical protein ACS0ZG_36675, partial [Burkholderia gladioli]|uniref:hypothetical protein n=1 Tax=Burkholderia gladioli TaxID=28095 RepID=UPI003F7AB959